MAFWAIINPSPQPYTYHEVAIGQRERYAVKSKLGYCPCCHRYTHLTFHHLIPKKLHRRPHFRKRFSKETLRQGVDICRTCHNGIHSFYSEMHLGKHLCTIDLILGDEKLRDYFEWVSKQKIVVDK